MRQAGASALLSFRRQKPRVRLTERAGQLLKPWEKDPEQVGPCMQAAVAVLECGVAGGVSRWPLVASTSPPSPVFAPQNPYMRTCMLALPDEAAAAELVAAIASARRQLASAVQVRSRADGCKAAE